MAPTAVERLIEALWKAGGTDLHIAVGAPPSIRVDGDLHPIAGEFALSADTVRTIVFDLVGDRFAALTAGHDVDFGFTWRDVGRIRGNAFRDRGAFAMALRLIPLEIPSFDSLGLPPVIEGLLTAPSGLVIVTGPTGSGKSTTLAAMVDAINRTRAGHIITIEDPIEYLHPHHRAVVNQRQIGDDASSFPEALRAVLREDPDVVLVGEMRDIDSIAATLTIAETGHLVFTTLHTNDTAQAIDRIVDVFPADRRPQIQVQLASTLQGVVYQRLVPRIEGGLVGAYEVMVATHAVRNLVRDGRTRQLRNAVAIGQSEGMQTLEMSLSQLVASGIVDHDVAAGVSLHPHEVASGPATPARPRAKGGH